MLICIAFFLVFVVQISSGDFDNASSGELPTVLIQRYPDGPVSEEEDINVTLHCDLAGENLPKLTSVSWFMNGDLIRHLPDPKCEELGYYEEAFVPGASDYEIGFDIGSGNGADISDRNVNFFCDVDPTELLLKHVTRDFSGNFSCSGSNRVGEGPTSDVLLLNVLHLPGKTKISIEEKTVLRGDSVTMQCSIKDLGNPEANQIIWKRGEEELEEASNTLTLDNISIQSQGSISCEAVNDLGHGEADIFQVNVFAPPSFLKSLPEMSTFVSHDKNVNLQCQVECFPACKVNWRKDDEIIEFDDDRYIIEETIIPEDIESNKFRSISSTLSWNFDILTNQKLNHSDSDFRVSCFVDESDIGPLISSSTKTKIEYAPHNIFIASTHVAIEENKEFEPLFCSGKGNPEPSIFWKFGDLVITTENTLDFSEPILRDQAGEYACHVSNKHGEEVVTVTVDVLFKPLCSINHVLENEEVVLICSSQANPQDMKFLWEKENTTFGGQKSEDIIESEVRLKIINESLGTYHCHVSNAIGQGKSCKIDLTKEMMTKGLTDEILIILIAVACSIILLLLIISIIICLYCGGKKKKIEDTANMKENKSESPLLEEDQLPTNVFYENLPFQGLKKPPKQVVEDPKGDLLDYVDDDYLETYAHGPIKYREASEKNAILRKKKLEERKSDHFT